MTPAELRTSLQGGLDRLGPDAKDGDLACTLVGKGQPFPGMRLKVLSYGEDGVRIYGVSTVQARRLLAALDEARL